MALLRPPSFFASDSSAPCCISGKISNAQLQEKLKRRYEMVGICAVKESKIAGAAVAGCTVGGVC